MALEICRICGTTESLKHIFGEGNDELVMQIRVCTNIQIDANDSLPKFVCNECEKGLAFSYRLRQRSEQTEKKLRQDLLATTTETIAQDLESPISTEKNKLTEEFGSKQIWTKEEEDAAEPSEHDSLIERTSNSNEDARNDYLVDQEDLSSQEEWIDEDDKLDNEGVLEYTVIEKFTDDLTEIFETTKVPNESITQDSKNATIMTAIRKKFQCEICSELFDKKSQYMDHIRKHEEKRFNCNYCNKWFTYRYRYEEHVKNHFTTERAFPCPQCDKSYTNQSNMERHVRFAHNQERKFQCAECGASFGRSDILKMHMAKHTEIKKFQCALCQKTFKTNQALHYHMKTHQSRPDRIKKPRKKKVKHKTRTPVYRCDHCDKISHHRTTHLNHMRTHTDERPFECSTCSKAFRTSHAKSNHELLHTDKRPHVCKECGIAFRQISHLKSHMLTHTGDKPHVCEVCQKAFAMRSNLVVHMRIHTGEMAYACDSCPKKFLLASQFKRHKLSHTTFDAGDSLPLDSYQENGVEVEGEFHDQHLSLCIEETEDNIVVETTP